MKLKHRIGRWLLKDAPPKKISSSQAIQRLIEGHERAEAVLVPVRSVSVRLLQYNETLIVLPGDTLVLSGKHEQRLRATMVVEGIDVGIDVSSMAYCGVNTPALPSAVPEDTQ